MFFFSLLYSLDVQLYVLLFNTYSNHSREATSQQLTQISQAYGLRLTLLYIHYILASHGIILISHTQPTPKLLPRTVWPVLKLPLFSSLAHFATSYACTLGYCLISASAWNEVVRAFCFMRTGWSEFHGADGHPHSCGLFCLSLPLPTPHSLIHFPLRICKISPEFTNLTPSVPTGNPDTFSSS